MTNIGKKKVTALFSVFRTVFRERKYEALVNPNIAEINYIAPIMFPTQETIGVDMKTGDLLVKVALYSNQGVYYLTKELIDVVQRESTWGFNTYTYQDGVVRIPLRDFVLNWEDEVELKTAVEDLLDCIAKAFLAYPSF